MARMGRWAAFFGVMLAMSGIATAAPLQSRRMLQDPVEGAYPTYPSSADYPGTALGDPSVPAEVAPLDASQQIEERPPKSSGAVSLDVELAEAEVLWSSAAEQVLPAAVATQSESLDVVSVMGANAYKYKSSSVSDRKMANEYIVFVEPWASVTAVVSQHVNSIGGVGLTRFALSSLKGFAARVPPGSGPSFLQALADDLRVAIIEDNLIMRIKQAYTQTSATWGIDRIDQATKVGSSAGTYRYTSTGAGVYAFVIDTGIKTGHTQFTNRLLAGATYVPGTRSANDDNGHGTHCAGTIGGTRYGVAKAVTLVPVKVCNSQGSCNNNDIIAGISWAVNFPNVANAKKVISLSLGGGYSPALNTAVANAVSAGVTVVVAAGNEGGKNACNYSPASSATAITVGATDNRDRVASYSNLGPCVDIFAPGSSITSAYHSSTTSTAVLSGTSMATPHVAGVAARILSTTACTGSAIPSCVANTITSQAKTGVVSGSIGQSPNRLLYRDPLA